MNMEKKLLLRILGTNEMMSLYGGYWITERVDGVLTTFWVVE